MREAVLTPEGNGRHQLPSVELARLKVEIQGELWGATAPRVGGDYAARETSGPRSD